MAGWSGKGGTLTIKYASGSSTVISTELGRWAVDLTNTLVDTTALGQRVEQAAVGSVAINVEAERIVAGKSGMRWTGTLGTYSGASLESVNVTLAVGDIDVSDVLDYIDQRVPDALNGTVEFATRYAGTQHFCNLVRAAASGNTSVAFTVVNSTGTTVVGGNAVLEAASHENPRGANRQTGRAKFRTVTAVATGYPMLVAAKETWSSVASQLFTLKDKAGTTVFKGYGYVTNATIQTGRNAAVRETMRAVIHRISTLL